MLLAILIQRIIFSKFVFFLSHSSAHKNISNAITTARISARETEEAVAKSKSKLYSVDGESVIGKSIHSLRKSQQIREDSINELNKIQGTASAIIQ